MIGRVVSVNVALELRTDDWTGRMGRSGIDKRPVAGPVPLSSAGLGGDTRIDPDHRYETQAAYVYSTADLDFWSAELGRQLVPGNLGENLTVSEMDCSALRVGERWRIGSTVVRVTVPRTPCRVFVGFWGVQDLVKRFTAAGRSGAYLAVEQPGEVNAGDEITLIDRPDHNVTILDLFTFFARGQQREMVDHVSTAQAYLPDKWQHRVRTALAHQAANS